MNDLPTMCVEAASQHVLRMSFLLEQEVYNFDRQVTTFWSHHVQRDITSPWFFPPFKLGGYGVGSSVQRHAAAPWRAWQPIIPCINRNNPVTGHTYPFHCCTTTKSPTSTTPNHPFTTHEQNPLSNSNHLAQPFA